jgi:hypothetical protein
VRQSALPACKHPRLQTIELNSRSSEPPELAPIYADAPEYRRENLPEWRIDVPEDLQISHLLVKAAGAALRRAHRDRRGNQPVHWNQRYQALLLKPGSGHLDIAVSKAHVPRALRIMQALLAGLQKRGYDVSVSSNNETIVSVLDETMEIALVERLRQVTVKRSYGTEVDLEASGRLRLRVGSSYSNSGIEDRPPRVIEELLNHFVSGLVRRALEAKRARAIRQEREQRWRIHDDERRRRQQERDSEQLRIRRLRSLAVRWARHQRLSEFVAAVEQRARTGQFVAQKEDVAGRLIERAKNYLRERDAVDAFLNEPWPSASLREHASMPWNWE